MYAITTALLIYLFRTTAVLVYLRNKENRKSTFTGYYIFRSIYAYKTFFDMSRKHALLSASGASKWLNCTPSAKIESRLKESTSTYADEGTTAHNLAENELRYYFKFITKLRYTKIKAEIQESEYYNESMQEYVNDYTDYCIELYNSYTLPPFVAIEDTVYLEPYIPGGYSHLDFSLIGGNILDIVDYKHGKGVAVEAKENKQALIYAVGAYLSYSFMSDIQTIRITIYQPRISNITQWQLSIEELLQWANTELTQKAALAFEGKGELKAGEWCRFCKAKATCRAFAELNLNLAKLDFESLKDMETVEGLLYEDVNKQTWLTDEEISSIIKGAEIFKNWINGILDYALKEALEGKQWPGLKVVRGRSIRRYKEPEKIINILHNMFEDGEAYMNFKLKPITEIEKLFGKDRMQKLLGKYIDKPEGGPSLVLVSDKRPKYDKLKEAQNDFSNL